MGKMIEILVPYKITLLSNCADIEVTVTVF